MVLTMYQQYMYIIGKLKDVHKLDVEVSHKDIHTFYKDQTPLFKLLFGQYVTDGHHSIVVSFHIDVDSPQAIYWFLTIQGYQPDLTVTEQYAEDDKGEMYLGDDAKIIKNLRFQRDTLEYWLTNKSEDQMKDFVEGKIVGKIRDPKKSYDSRHEMAKAIIDFERLREPDDDEDTH